MPSQSCAPRKLALNLQAETSEEATSNIYDHLKNIHIETEIARVFISAYKEMRSKLDARVMRFFQIDEPSTGDEGEDTIHPEGNNA